MSIAIRFDAYEHSVDGMLIHDVTLAHAKRPLARAKWHVLLLAHALARYVLAGRPF
jgi:hypothetical protein